MNTLKERYSKDQLQSVQDNQFCYHAIEKPNGIVVPVIVKEGISEPIELPIYWGKKLETVLYIARKMNSRRGLSDEEVEKMVKNACLSLYYY